jgi:tripartite-type tricarboxylate transporter receptor subunit TctC
MLASVRSVTRRAACLAALALAVPGVPALAQDFPARPITLVVPYPPGSATDVLARLLAPKLSESLRQNVIVENRGGASTNLGTEFVARAAPDGYTVLIQAPNIATNEFAFKSLRWKRDDFAPVTLLVRWSNVLVAGPSATVRDFRQLAAASKANPAAHNYGSPGVGSLSHLAIEILKQRGHLRMEHVAFTGPAPMLTSLFGGHIQYAATNPANFMSHLREGKHKLTPLVVLGAQRDPALPDVPALAELGIAGVESNGWLGALVPARTPPAVVTRLNAELLKALRAPDVQERLRSLYLEPMGSTPDEFGRFIEAEHRKWADAARAAGIQPE